MREEKRFDNLPGFEVQHHVQTKARRVHVTWGGGLQFECGPVELTVETDGVDLRALAVKLLEKAREREAAQLKEMAERIKREETKLAAIDQEPLDL